MLDPDRRYPGVERYDCPSILRSRNTALYARVFVCQLRGLGALNQATTIELHKLARIVRLVDIWYITLQGCFAKDIPSDASGGYGGDSESVVKLMITKKAPSDPQDRAALTSDRIGLGWSTEVSSARQRDGRMP